MRLGQRTRSGRWVLELLEKHEPSGHRPGLTATPSIQTRIILPFFTLELSSL